MKRIFIAVAFIFTSSATWAMPAFKTPDFMKVEIVADKMRLNGLEMRSYTFESSRPAVEIEKFYQKLWSGKGKQSRVKPWNILSYADDGFLYVVQIREDDSLAVTGLLSISNLKTLEKGFVRGKGFPMPGSSVVINDITANDSGKRSRTLVIENTKSVADNMRYYRRHFGKEGWVELAGDKADSGHTAGTETLILNKGGDELNMVFQDRDNKTFVVAVEVEK